MQYNFIIYISDGESMTQVSKTTHHNIFNDIPAFINTRLLFPKDTPPPFSYDLQRLWRPCENGVCSRMVPRPSEVTWKGSALKQPPKPLKTTQEWGMLSRSFQRVQRQQKSIFQSYFKNKSLMWPRAASGTPQGPVNRKTSLPEGKWLATHPGDHTHDWLWFFKK